MGQAWCKEKTTKAEDSKSPLDRVFVRCAHRIYPSLKEEGSVLGGATQRVTSSEIGYAGSPPREVLTRGRSIDSVDRPFHPSDWVDVNLEVPSTPRPGSALTNLTVDTSLYPATTPTSSCSNLKESAPVPPPRRKKRNKGRPLPPKPDEATESAPANLKRSETGDEPLYSSVKSPKSSGDDEDAEEEIRADKHRLCDDAPRDGRKTKEIYEHKVNGTGRIISSDMVSGKRTSHAEDKKTGKASEINQNHPKPHETEEYERFARNRTSKDSSTPNREDKRGLMDPEKQIKDISRDAEKSNGHARTKNYSTVSLPNYDELDVARHQTKGMKGQQAAGDRTKSRRPVRSSTGSLPAESFLAPFSEKTSVRLEDYILSRGSPDNLSEDLDLEKLAYRADTVVEAEFLKYDPSKSEDWELGGIGNCELSHQDRLSFEAPRRISNGNDTGEDEDEDVVDYARKSPVYMQKPESFGKTPSPAFGEPEYSEVDPNRTHLRYFKPPTLEDSCRNSTACETSASKEPFYLDEAKHRSVLDTIGVSGGKMEADRSDQPGMIFRSSLSNESEPEEDTYEPKELSGRPASLIRTISEESLPREMLEQQELENFFDEKLAKDTHNKLRKNLDRKTTTPPPSPEPRIKPELLDNDHSTLLKVLKDETAEESNLSSMTPSLTELEAALSDMLEKEDPQEPVKDEAKTDKLFAPDSKIDDAKINRNPSVDVADDPVQGSANQSSVSLGLILENRKPINSRKVSFCAWEETLLETNDRDDREFTERPTDLDKNTVSRRNEGKPGHIGEDVVCPTDQPPEKPTRMNRSLEDLMEDSENVPTPPRRRHRSLGKRDGEIARNGSAVTEAYPNDRLI